MPLEQDLKTRKNFNSFGLFLGMDEITIRQVAAHMRKLHGCDAELASSVQAEGALNKGNIRGFHTWNRVATLVNDLERKGAGTAA